MVASAEGKEHQRVAEVDVYRYAGPFVWLDNDRILYITIRPATNDSGGMAHGIYSISLSTGEISPFYLTEGFIEHLDRSPDGSQLAFVHNGKTAEICTLGVADRSLKPIKSGDSTDRYPALLYPRFSPDGKEIAYTRTWKNKTEESRRSIMIVSADGGEPREIYGSDRRDERFYTSSSWLPDGRVTVEGPAYGLWVFPRDPNKAAERISEPSLKDAVNFRVSPDGHSAVFEKRAETHDVWLMENFLPLDWPNPGK
jgi:Tol biopolymer transport system component